jgi:hypothetical protein
MMGVLWEVAGAFLDDPEGGNMKVCWILGNGRGFIGRMEDLRRTGD